jgi:hypothetical protein
MRIAVGTLLQDGVLENCQLKVFGHAPRLWEQVLNP